MIKFKPWCSEVYKNNIYENLPFITRYFELNNILREYNEVWKVMIESINNDYDCLKITQT